MGIYFEGREFYFLHYTLSVLLQEHDEIQREHRLEARDLRCDTNDIVQASLLFSQRLDAHEGERIHIGASHLDHLEDQHIDKIYRTASPSSQKYRCRMQSSLQAHQGSLYRREPVSNNSLQVSSQQADVAVHRVNLCSCLDNASFGFIKEIFREIETRLQVGLYFSALHIDNDELIITVMDSLEEYRQLGSAQDMLAAYTEEVSHVCQGSAITRDLVKREK